MKKIAAFAGLTVMLVACADASETTPSSSSEELTTTYEGATVTSERASTGDIRTTVATEAGPNRLVLSWTPTTHTLGFGANASAKVSLTPLADYDLRRMNDFARDVWLAKAARPASSRVKPKNDMQACDGVGFTTDGCTEAYCSRYYCMTEAFNQCVVDVVMQASAMCDSN